MKTTCMTVAFALVLAGSTAARAGLLDSVYHGFGSNPSGPNNGLMDGNFGGDNTAVTNVTSYAATHTPDYTFVNNQTQFVYGNGSGTPTNTFLGADANGAASTDTLNVNDTIFDAKGFFIAPTSGTYTVNIGNTDDIAAVFVGGTGTSGTGTDVANSGWQGASPTSNTIHLNAGYTPVEVIWGNGFGGAYLQSLGEGLPGVEILGPDGAQVAFVLQSPEPSSIVALCGIGATGLFLTVRRYRRRRLAVA